MTLTFKAFGSEFGKHLGRRYVPKLCTPELLTVPIRRVRPLRLAGLAGGPGRVSKLQVQPTAEPLPAAPAAGDSKGRGLVTCQPEALSQSRCGWRPRGPGPRAGPGLPGRVPFAHGRGSGGGGDRRR